MKRKLLMTMDLQFFADPANDDKGGVNSGGQTPPEFDVTGLTEEQVAAVKEQFGFKNDDEVDSIVKSKHSRWQKDLDAEKKEAERLAKMNADEKAAHKQEQLEKRIAEYEQKEAFAGMAKEASSMLKAEGISVPDNILECLVSSDAEGTKANVTEFVSYMQEQEKQWEVKRNTRQTPKGTSGKSELSAFDKILAKYN